MATSAVTHVPRSLPGLHQYPCGVCVVPGQGWLIGGMERACVYREEDGRLVQQQEFPTPTGATWWQPRLVACVPATGLSDAPLLLVGNLADASEGGGVYACVCGEEAASPQRVVECDYIWDMSVSEDGERLAVLSGQEGLDVYDLQRTGRHTLSAHRIAACDWDKLWELLGEEYNQRSVCWGPHGRLLVAGWQNVVCLDAAATSTLWPHTAPRRRQKQGYAMAMSESIGRLFTRTAPRQEEEDYAMAMSKSKGSLFTHTAPWGVEYSDRGLACWAGQLYVCDWRNRRVSVLSADTGQLLCHIPVPVTADTWLGGLAMDQHDTLYVVDVSHRELISFCAADLHPVTEENGDFAEQLREAQEEIYRYKAEISELQNQISLKTEENKVLAEKLGEAQGELLKYKEAAMMSEEEVDVLQKNRYYLMQELNIDKMMGELLEIGVLQKEEQDQIASKDSRMKKNEFLLNRLPQKGPGAYITFLFILRREASHIAKKLDRTLEVLTVCKDFKKELTETEPHVLGVWPARVPDEDNILLEEPVIVVNMEDTCFQEPVTEYKGYKVRYVDVSTINSEVSLFTSCDQTLSPEEDNYLGDIISRHVDRLFEAHSNMTLVMPSPIRIQKGEMVPCKCIMIFCKAKGFVPYSEELFETAIDNVPVDIVEGMITLGGCSHSDLYTGCTLYHQDYPELIGTLGGFVVNKDDETKLGLLTCCHCALPTPNHAREEVAKNIHDQPDREPEGQVGHGIQESHFVDGRGEKCAKICSHRCELGNYCYKGTEYFVDAACAYITNQQLAKWNVCPRIEEVNFARCGLDPGLSFDKVHANKPEDALQHNGIVYKFGQTSGLTTGQIVTHYGQGKIDYQKREIEIGSTVKTAKNLFVVKNLREKHVFFQYGDSGSLVFFVNPLTPKVPHVIGMGIAVMERETMKRTSDNTEKKTETCLTLATPIRPVLESLRVKLKNDPGGFGMK